MRHSHRALLRAGVQIARAYNTVSNPLHVCIVGAGPAGFYTADKLLKRGGDSVRVDLIDRLPFPFGLVRSGVAPDHPEVKNVTHHFSDLLQDPHTTLLGNVTVGRDVSLPELRRHYNAVVLAYGAESDRRLGIPGEDSTGVFAAREFVWWYNAHPDARQLPVDLSRVESVAICGIGNVAVDCARLLLRPPGELAATDIAHGALRQLRQASRVKEVHLFARRGPLQAACTPSELKELVNTKGVRMVCPESQLAVSEQDRALMASVRIKRRIHELISRAVQRPDADAARSLHFQFYRNPVEILADAGGAVRDIRVERTQLQQQPSGQVVAVGTGEYETHAAQLVLKSIGYKALPLEGLPFDARSGTIPSAQGRVLSAGSTAPPATSAPRTEPGLYVSGWIKRGPTGVIGTNLVDAEETVQSLMHDREQLPAVAGGVTPGAAGVRQLLNAKNVLYVDARGWQRIDQEEVQRGKQQGKPREKIDNVDEAVHVADLSSTA